MSFEISVFSFSVLIFQMMKNLEHEIALLLKMQEDCFNFLFCFYVYIKIGFRCRYVAIFLKRFLVL